MIKINNEAVGIGHSTPCSIKMAISLSKIGKILQKSQISDNPTDKIETQTIVPTQSHGVSWGPGVLDANLPADEYACRCMCNQSLCGSVKTEMFWSQNRCPLIRCLPYPVIFPGPRQDVKRLGRSENWTILANSGSFFHTNLDLSVWDL